MFDYDYNKVNKNAEKYKKYKIASLIDILLLKCKTLNTHNINYRVKIKQ